MRLDDGGGSRLEIAGPRDAGWAGMGPATVPEVRAALRDVLLRALREGAALRPEVTVPEGVLDRFWDATAGGVHLNPHRKVIRGDAIVLVGHLGKGTLRGRRLSRRTVAVFRIVLPPDGMARWEGPEAMPARRYVREHLDAWPGCVAPFALAVGGAAVAIAAVLLGRGCR